jgi:uncharacterized protein YndB with AHSA1/START domain
MFKTIALAVLVLIAVAIIVILIVAATKPDTFRVQRVTTIKAPPATIFALINDFHSWGTWSPWEKKDPEMKRTFSGAESGKGSIYAWDGNKNVGAGQMEITESSAPSKVVIKLDFLKPFEGHNTAEFTMEPQGDATKITWLMYGPSSYMHKVMSTLMNMDKMIGNDFEAGLANLKTTAEK